MELDGLHLLSAHGQHGRRKTQWSVSGDEWHLLGKLGLWCVCAASSLATTRATVCSAGRWSAIEFVSTGDAADCFLEGVPGSVCDAALIFICSSSCLSRTDCCCYNVIGINKTKRRVFILHEKERLLCSSCFVFFPAWQRSKLWDNH